MRRHSYLLPALALGVLVLSVATLGCDSANPVAPGGSVLTVSANPTQIGLNQTSVITVTGFKPDGNRLNPGSQITLTTDLGVLGSTLVEIGEDGRASTVLSPDGTPGTATVTAALPAGEAMATATVEIGETNRQPTLTVLPSPSRINIEQNSTITVVARNVDGSPLEGGRVRLRTTLGVLGQETLTTSADGEARTLLRPDGRSGTATVTGSVESGMEVTAEVTIIRAEIIVDVFPRIIDIGDTAEVTVQLRDEDGISLVAGHELRLTANLGTLDPSTVVTNGRGEGTSTYTAGTRAGNDTITVFFGNADPGTDSVDLRAAPASLILTADRVTVPPDIDTTVNFMATVADAEGLLLANEVVNFTVEQGISATFDPGRTVTTDSGGRATVAITFQQTTLPAEGESFTVTAAARGEGIQDMVVIRVQ